jgi:16S rRNA (guanine966-N2)-methyltransferase
MKQYTAITVEVRPVRIIGGKLRSRKFDAPLGNATRPTSDRAKVALFNILQGRLPCAQVLDGFAGSGALSFEALSRGAAMAVLFEQNGAAAELLRQNAAKLNIEEQVDVWHGDFISCSAELQGIQFDMVFLDPPYASGLLEEAIKASQRLLAPGGIIVAEHSSIGELPGCIGNLVKSDCRQYGAAAFSFYTRQDNE